jgi:purine-binding chemotaxis protein CheW
LNESAMVRRDATAPAMFLEFAIGPMRLGVDASTVREVVRAVAIAPLPKAPPIIEGAINYRGIAVAVFDVRQRFGIPPVSLSPEHHFVIVESGGRTVAIRTDRAVGLVAVSPESLDYGVGALVGNDHASAIATTDDGLLVIHDVARFLSLDEAAQLDAALRDRDVPVMAHGARL